MKAKRPRYPYAKEIKVALAATPTADECAGYHGTSVWAVIFAAKFGTLPNRCSEGLFYYTPRQFADAITVTQQYAHHNSLIHFLKEFIPYDSIEDAYAARDAGDPDFDSTVIDLNEEGLLHGVVITLADSIGRLPRAEDEAGDERCVRVPRSGLPMRYIAKIELLGDADRRILEDHGLG